MKKNYQPPTAVVMDLDYFGILCSSTEAGGSLGGYFDEVLPDYGEDD